ncbi:MAG: GGDEF domain-containing protein [Shewanella sp.]|nr:GGDEF domain-containing protein [Shewanella sp.]
MKYIAIYTLLAIAVFSTPVMANDVDHMLDNLEHSLLSEPNKALEGINALTGSTIQFNSHQEARFKTLKSIKLLFNGDYFLALELLSEAEKLTSQESQLNSIYLYQATAYISLKNYESGLNSISKNLARIKFLDDDSTLSSTYQRLANLYLELGAYNETLFYANKTLEVIPETDKKSRCYSLLLISVTSLKLEKLASAKSEFTDTLSFCEANHFPLIAAMSKKGLGMIELKLGDFAYAKETFLESLADYNTFQYQLEINHIYALLAETFLGLNNIKEAKRYATLVINLPSEPNNFEFKKIATKVFAELSSQSGDYQLAYQYLNQYQEINAKLLDDTKAKANAYQMAKFENGEKSREINLLNKDRELYTAKAALTESQRRNERMMNTLIFGGLVVLAIFALVMTMQKRKYKQLAQHDALTGIFNRGTAQNIAENSFIKTVSKREMFSVIMFDLDYFKRINDNYGHGTGDWVLKKVAEVINKASRSDDVFARFGGEEFALFLPNTDEAKAKIMAEEYRGLIQSIETRFSGHNFDITASFGVSTSSEDDLSLDPLLHRADIAMYHSKEQGRNCVTLYKPEIEQSRSGYQKSKMALG